MKHVCPKCKRDQAFYWDGHARHFVCHYTDCCHVLEAQEYMDWAEARVEVLESLIKKAVHRFGKKIGKDAVVNDEDKVQAIMESILVQEDCITWMTNDERTAKELSIQIRDDRIAELAVALAANQTPDDPAETETAHG